MEKALIAEAVALYGLFIAGTLFWVYDLISEAIRKHKKRKAKEEE